MGGEKPSRIRPSRDQVNDIGHRPAGQRRLGPGGDPDRV